MWWCVTMGRHSADSGVVLQSYKRDGSGQDSDSDHSHVNHGKHKGKPEKIRVGKPLPQASSNILSFTSTWWLTPLVYHISRTVQTGLGDQAVWSCAPVDGCQENAKRCCVKFVRPMMWRLMVAAALFASSLNVLSGYLLFSHLWQKQSLPEKAAVTFPLFRMQNDAVMSKWRTNKSDISLQ